MESVDGVASGAAMLPGEVGDHPEVWGQLRPLVNGGAAGGTGPATQKGSEGRRLRQLRQEQEHVALGL